MGWWKRAPGMARSCAEGPIPFRVTFTVLPADRNHLVINSGEVPATRAEAAQLPFGGSTP
jgi:hypothetical protein